MRYFALAPAAGCHIIVHDSRGNNKEAHIEGIYKRLYAHRIARRDLCHSHLAGYNNAAIFWRQGTRQSGLGTRWR